MKKIRLNLDDLKVDSFETTPEAGGRKGTLFGYQSQLDTCHAGCPDDLDGMMGGTTSPKPGCACEVSEAICPVSETICSAFPANCCLGTEVNCS